MAELLFPYISSITGEANTYKTTIANPPETSDNRNACFRRYSINNVCFFAAASLMEGTSAVESEVVMNDGSISSGNAKPVNSPYCLVARCVTTPAIAKLWATTIGSKNQEIDPIILLPKVGTAIRVKSLNVSFPCLADLKKFCRIRIRFFSLNIKNK